MDLVPVVAFFFVCLALFLGVPIALGVWLFRWSARKGTELATPKPSPPETDDRSS